jgi:integrase
MPFLSDDYIRTLTPPSTGNKVTFDQPDPSIPATKDVVTAGLGIRITAAGHRAWVFDYRLRDGSGKQRRLTIARFPYLGTGAARKRARKLREEIEAGGDPQGVKAAKRKVPTINKLCDQFEAEQVALIQAKKLRESTFAGYRRMIRLYIRPELGSMKVTEVDDIDVKRVFRKITASGKLVAANRVVALLSTMMTFAIGEKIRTDNPCTLVKHNKELPRERDIRPDELDRFTAELAKHNNPAANVLKLLLVTGARKSECMNMRWADISFGENPSWHRKAVDIKGGRDHFLPLNSVAAQQLIKIHDEAIARDGQLGEFVFPGTGRKRRVVDLRKTWLMILKNAGITDLHIHDLRHHFASQLASSGASELMIGALLAHRSAASTRRYVRMFQNPQREASERAAAIIAAAGKAPAGNEPPEPKTDVPEPTQTNVRQIPSSRRQ